MSAENEVHISIYDHEDINQSIRRYLSISIESPSIEIFKETPENELEVKEWNSRIDEGWTILFCYLEDIQSDSNLPPGSPLETTVKFIHENALLIVDKFRIVNLYYDCGQLETESFDVTIEPPKLSPLKKLKYFWFKPINSQKHRIGPYFVSRVEGLKCDQWRYLPNKGQHHLKYSEDHSFPRIGFSFSSPVEIGLLYKIITICIALIFGALFDNIGETVWGHAKAWIKFFFNIFN